MRTLTAAGGDVTQSLSPERIELAEKIFSLLTEVLNELHDSDYPIRFWKLISEEHVRTVINHHELLKSSLLSESGKNNSQNDFTEETGRRFKTKLAAFRRFVNTRKNIKEMDAVMRSNDQLIAGFEGIPLIAEETGGRAIHDAELFPFGRGKRSKRKKAAEIAGRYQSTFEKNIIHTLPPLLVEQFEKVFGSMVLHSPKSKTLHLRGSFKLGYRQMLIAKYQLHGSKLIWYQNGAVVGEVETKYGGYLARSVADEYRTWGWKQRENDIPWKGYDLVRFGNAYRSAGENGKRCDLLISYPKIRYEKSYFRGLTETLLNGLDEKKYRDILIRPYPSRKEVPEKLFGFIRDKRVTVNKKKTSMAGDLRRSRIAVHINVPATTFLEAISVDHPSVGILRNSHPTAMAQPFYEFLLDVGVLHENAESMAGHLSSVKPEEWWSSVVKHEMYIRFKETFVNGSPINGQFVKENEAVISDTNWN
jgi:putative transferase (TIGR04331 family)